MVGDEIVGDQMLSGGDTEDTEYGGSFGVLWQLGEGHMILVG